MSFQTPSDRSLDPFCQPPPSQPVASSSSSHPAFSYPSASSSATPSSSSSSSTAFFPGGLSKEFFPSRPEEDAAGLRILGTGMEGRVPYPAQWSSEGSAERSKGPLLNALNGLLRSSTSGPILEIASGFGIHVEHFASAHPTLEFQPTECDPYLVSEIDRDLQGTPNVRKAKLLDVLNRFDWKALKVNRSKDGLSGEVVFSGVVIENLLHVAPPECTTAIFQALSPASPLSLLDKHQGWIAIYGAFVEDGQYLGENDRAFDAHIKSQSPYFGLRDIARFVLPEAERNGFLLVERLSMPRGNTLLLFKPNGNGSMNSSLSNTQVESSSGKDHVTDGKSSAKLTIDLAAATGVGAVLATSEISWSVA
ncbi:Protein of unknown function DUF938 [Phaffia rhodozyma]|uniref:S-adenosyl-L-methionine-dependent methyltransferase n=1 Tax=Phaffia rhodozyma TaxID=264483 RepID=A0A0F7SUN1_PHARH|nr:Protein of unknown function DUF938 [Phaffia rhodozyma]